MSTARTVRRTRTARLLGSVGIVGAAAAVAGMGTFGAFTDSTSPAAIAAQTGVVSLGVSAGDGSATVPLDFAAVVPGSSAIQLLNLVNDGDTALAGVRLATVATSSSVLDRDATNGLQTTVRSCSVPWSGSTCAGQERVVLASGPVVRDVALADPFSLTAGAVDHLAVNVALPVAAGDGFKEQRSALSLTFTGTQRAGTSR